MGDLSYVKLLSNVSCVMPHPQPLPTGRGVDNQIVTNSPSLWGATELEGQGGANTILRNLR
jgi:hypothetical protein